jgi:Kef-type K+ transport system membrane component KefB
MDKLTHTEVINLLLQLSIMLIAGRFMAEVARNLKQPSVVGEIFAGILLGPTILGALSPELFQKLFPSIGSPGLVLDGFVQVAVVLLLFIAGLEVDLQVVTKQGKQAAYTSLFSLVIPLALGFAFPYFLPEFFGHYNEDTKLVFALFLGTTMGITALPVVARILMDLNVFKSNIGMLIIASAMVNDLVGWLIFTVVLSMMGATEGGMGVAATAAVAVGFTLLMLTVGRGLINRSLPWINKKLAWPGGLLSLSLALCFLAAAFTESIGIHAIFGSFIIGVALGDSEHLTERAKEIIHQFINNIFAPLFFVSIGLYINFVESFNPMLVLAITSIAFVGKISGATFGARLGGLPKFQALAVGFGMNTHGTLEVILGAIALQEGFISNEVFVAIISMVIITIVCSAPLMSYSLKREKIRIQEHKAKPASRQRDRPLL